MRWICLGCLAPNDLPGDDAAAPACACGARAALVRAGNDAKVAGCERLAVFRRSRLETQLLPAVREHLERRGEAPASERLDLVRALVFARALAGYWNDHGQGQVDPVALRYAVALLPLGRAAQLAPAGLRLVRSGKRLCAVPAGWREASARVAQGWLALEGAPGDLCAEVAALVGPAPARSLVARIVRDAWLLQRLRPGHPRPFDAALFGFGRDADGMLLDAGSHDGARVGLIREARRLVEATAFLAEDPAFRAGGRCLSQLEDVLIEGQRGWPLLAAAWMAPEPRASERGELCLQLADEEGDPKAGWRFSLRCDGAVTDGLTSRTGMLRAALPIGASAVGAKSADCGYSRSLWQLHSNSSAAPKESARWSRPSTT